MVSIDTIRRIVLHVTHETADCRDHRRAHRAVVVVCVVMRLANKVHRYDDDAYHHRDECEWIRLWHGGGV